MANGRGFEREMQIEHWNQWEGGASAYLGARSYTVRGYIMYGVRSTYFNLFCGVIIDATPITKARQRAAGWHEVVVADLQQFSCYQNRYFCCLILSAGNGYNILLLYI